MSVRFRAHVLVVSLSCLFVVSAASAQTIWYVNAASPCPGSGTQANPFCTIQAAITAAAANATPVDEIHVADGIYTGTGNKDLDFHGKAITVRSESGNPAACIIDCQSSGRGFYFHTSETAASVVDGLTIRNGYVTSSSPGSYYGGGVYCSVASPTLTNCMISGNTVNGTYGLGGGVYCTSSSSPTLTNCVISGNTAWAGAGIDCYTSCSPTLTNCTIIGNTATSNGGGGVYCHSSSNVKLINCVISGNKANGSHGYGGGMYCDYSSPVLTNCTITRNYAATVYGGGVFCYSSTSLPKFTNCIFWGDTSPEFYVDSGTPVVTYCDVQSGYTGTGNINVNPLFVDADGPDNDPNTPADNNYRLSPGSPCIDAGTNAPPGGLPAYDADGSPRPVDGNNDGLAVADMGAYEAGVPTTPLIAVAPAQIAFAIPEGQTASAEATLSIHNIGIGTLHWTLTETTSWLQADPPQGESTGEVDTVTLSANVAGLVAGTYSTNLQVSDPLAANNPMTVEVILHVSGTLHVPSQYATIQGAIDAAVSTLDQVVVADGTYTGTGNKDLDFHGKAITVRSESGNPAACIIDCQGSGRGFYFHAGETAASMVQGFTIRNGYVTSSSPGWSGYGGGVYCSGASPTLTNCVISGNTAGGTSNFGGGIACVSSSLTLTNCTLNGNTAAGYEGGGIFFSGGHPTLTNCTLSGNTVAGYGGGIFSASSSPKLTNCTLSGNTAAAGNGGGIHSSDSFLELVNCTFSRNRATGNGGGVYFSFPDYPYPSISSTLTNCILWGDTPQEIYLYSCAISATYCDVQGGFAGTGNINVDPLFVDADGPDNDPNTPADNNYRLSPGSPCIDTGNNAAIPPGITTDIEGHPRIFDGNSDGVSVVDMGAYEYTLAGDFNYDGAINATDYWYIHDGLGKCSPQPGYTSHVRADMDHDGCITLVDYQKWLLSYRATYGMDFIPPRNRTPVPVPAPDLDDGVLQGPVRDLGDDDPSSHRAPPSGKGLMTGE